MSKYARANDDVAEMAAAILCKFDTHKPLLDAKVRIDYMMAYADEDENGNPTGPAIMCRGFAADGTARKIPVRDRVMGRGDCEVTVDGDWWDNEARTDQERMALLDHELHHFEVCKDEDGKVLLDSHDRPKIKLRKHDVEFGWFKIIAQRHGPASGEQQQAKSLFENSGQYFWPELLKLQSA